MSQLRLGVVGGLGAMLSPSAKHLKMGGPAKVLRVHDRGVIDDAHNARRQAWREHGAELVGTFDEVTMGVDGVIVCCGKNGDDARILRDLVPALKNRAGTGVCPFVVHWSTVSTDFTKLAADFCQHQDVGYVNCPLTGGVTGAEQGTMLILASGPALVLDTVWPTFEAVGKPIRLGERVEAGAVVKLLGQMLVFNGLVGVTSACGVHTEALNDGQLGGEVQIALFDDLMKGAGGTMQWEKALKLVLTQGWGRGFLTRHAAVDAVYAAHLAHKAGLSMWAVLPMIQVAAYLGYVLRKYPDQSLATAAVIREILRGSAKDADAYAGNIGYLASVANDQMLDAIDLVIRSFPDAVRDSVLLNVTSAHFGA